MIYIVKEDYEGAVMIGDRPYRPSQIIRDDGANPKVTRSIEKLLKLEECPISLVEEPAPPATVATEVPPASPSGSNPKGKPSASEKGGE